MNLRKLVAPLVALVAGVALVGASYVTRQHWLPLVRNSSAENSSAENSAEGPASETADAAPPEKIFVTPQAQKNLGLSSKPLAPTTYWKTLEAPGTVIDRPGRNELAVVAPASGVVTRLGRFPSEVARPGDELVTLRLLSETLHQSQAELFKTTQDVALTQEQRKRLESAGTALPGARLAEIDAQITRFRNTIQALRHDLQARGLTDAQIDGAAGGKFVTEITVKAQALSPATSPGDAQVRAPLEVQELKVELGQQVQAGQTLCVLADRSSLQIEGRVFAQEAPLLEAVIAGRRPVEVDFGAESDGWTALTQPFHVATAGNVIDPATRTLAFTVPLANQSKVLDRDGRQSLLWRFRPGQKVRLRLPVARIDNVFVLPADAVARDGAGEFVFRQNSDTFERKPVRVIARDRDRVVVANDGGIPAGTFVAQSGAVQINRMLKAASGTVPKGFHVHADGSLHKNEDEGK